MTTGLMRAIFVNFPPVMLPTINFLRFTSIGIYADIQADTSEFGMSTAFQLATGSTLSAVGEEVWGHASSSDFLLRHGYWC